MERPPYGTAPASDTLGLRHVREALRDLEWPLTTRQLRDRAGAWRVPVTGARFVPLREMLDGVRDATFVDEADVARAIARAHPELRE